MNITGLNPINTFKKKKLKKKEEIPTANLTVITDFDYGYILTIVVTYKSFQHFT